MRPYRVSTAFDHDPDVAFTVTVMAASEEDAVQHVLRYLRLEFGLSADVPYRYRTL